MIVSTGIDIVEIDRIRTVMDRRGERFRNRVFTPDEILYCERGALRHASYAVRFAAKEAAMKALGTGWSGGVAWRDIEVVTDQSGSPTLRLSGVALGVFEALGATRSHVSLSHTESLAVAQVLFEAV